MPFYEEALTAFRAGETSRARQLSEQALEAARAAHDAASEVDALCMLSRVALREGDTRRVSALADEELQLRHPAVLLDRNPRCVRE